MLPSLSRTAPRWVRPEPLNVAAQVVGQPLATPQRRAAAMAVDLLLVALLSGAGGLWLVGGLVLVLGQLHSQRGAAGRRRALGWALAVLLGALVLQQVWQLVATARHPAAAVAAADPGAGPDADPDTDDAGEDDAADRLSTALLAASTLSTAPAAAAAPAASAAALTASAAAARIAALEAENARLREPRPWRLRDAFDGALEAVGASFGWGIVYFSLLPAWWAGQTPGKKLFGLRVVELAGQPLTVLRCLRRYGGYAAGMATGGLGYLQLLWDDNRQAIQDRCAHTVVIDLRALPQAASAAVAETA